MATVANDLIASGIQTKWLDKGVFPMAVTQAVASAVTANTYELFKVGSGVTILDIMIKLPALGTNSSKMSLGDEDTVAQFVSSALTDSASMQRGTANLPISYTAETKIIATGVGATTAAGTMYVVAMCCNTEDKD